MVQHVFRTGRLRCGLLLELPTPELESGFWQHERTLRAYVAWDVITIVYVSVAAVAMVKSQWLALSDPSQLRCTWHISLRIAVNLIACAVTAVPLLYHHAWYRQHRHHVAAANRLLRLALQTLGPFAATRHTHVIDMSPAGAAASSILHALRPLFWWPRVIATQSNWVFRFKVHLPLTLLSHAIACYVGQRHVPCALAASPAAVHLLQPACHGMAQLHELILGAIVGARFTAAGVPGGLKDSWACSSPAQAARTLLIFRLAAMVAVTTAGYAALEWRLKAAYVRQRLHKQLVYGPWDWGGRGESGLLQRVLAWVLVVPAGLAALWYACLCVAALLPPQQCGAGLGGCTDVAPLLPASPPSVERCGGAAWAHSDGLAAAALMYGETLSTLLLHVGVLGLV